jgi:hypothetical protein
VKSRNKPDVLKWLIIAAAVVVTVVLVVAYWPLTAHPLTLNPSRFTNPRAQLAYTIAQEHPGLLAQLTCKCGCRELAHHKTLLDCFKDEHGSHCPICMGEAIDADWMAKEGTPINQIQTYLNIKRYE